MHHTYVEQCKILATSLCFKSMMPHCELCRQQNYNVKRPNMPEHHASGTACQRWVGSGGAKLVGQRLGPGYPENLPFNQSYSLAIPSQSGKSSLGPLDTTLILTYLFWISLRKLSLPRKIHALIAWRHILSQSNSENKLTNGLFSFIYIIMPKKSAFKRERLTIYLSRKPK